MRCGNKFRVIDDDEDAGQDDRCFFFGSNGSRDQTEQLVRSPFVGCKNNFLIISDTRLRPIQIPITADDERHT